METYSPYCGTPPLPADLWGRWTFEPGLMIGLVTALAAGLWLVAPAQRARFVIGWALVALLFTSPLCALSMALFSARVAQHVLLTLVAAPLLAAALPRMVLPPAWAALGFAFLFWVWHAPGPYAATLTADGTYWAMHLSLLAAAIVFWASLRAHVATNPFACALAALFTGAQMSILSALLLFSANAWHPFHDLTAAPWGLTALADQQLAGAVMWVAGGLVFLAAIAGLVARFLRENTRSA